MFAIQEINQDIKEYLIETIKKELAPMHIVKINMREWVVGPEDDPTYEVDIVFDGEVPEVRKFTNLQLAVDEHFWDIKEEHRVIFSILRPEDEEWIYDSMPAERCRGHTAWVADGARP